MTVPLDVPADHRGLVLGIIAAYLPPETLVWVFGSRATGTARRYSDLDLAIDAGRVLTLDEAAVLREVFEESDLPYKVDVVDWRTVSDHFRELIAAQRVPLVLPRQPRIGAPAPSGTEAG